MSALRGRAVGVNATSRPERISGRSDALQLWMHLFERGISFRCEEDPAEWVDVEGRSMLTEREIATVRRLFTEVDRLGAETFDCYADAESLRELVMLGALPRQVAAPIDCRSRRGRTARSSGLRFAS